MPDLYLNSMSRAKAPSSRRPLRPFMNPRSLSNIAIAGFVMLGALCVGLRYRSICRDQAAREDTQWEINYSARFEPTVATSQQESQVRLAVPFDTRHCQNVRGRER